MLSALMESVRLPAPIMVGKAEAARLCGMSVATYDKYAGQGLLPPMNRTGRVSVEAVKRAAFKLDGIPIETAVADESERALQEWKRDRKK